MTIELSESIDVAASPQEVLELVLDLETYRRLDPKIKKVRAAPVLDAEGRGTALFEKRVGTWMAGELPGEMTRIRDHLDPTLR